MNKLKTFFIVFFIISNSVLCQTSQNYLNMANKAYDLGNKDKAKELYTKAAAMNNPDAHYALAYKFVITPEEKIFHFSEAAKMGHSEAVAEMFDALLFRANSLSLANPEKAYEIYKQAKSHNPALSFFNEEGYVSTIKKCIEAGYLDEKKFIEQYNVKEIELNSTYSIWELAAEASRGGRFGPPNTKLVLQLVCRGSSVPAELEFAVDSVYGNWKANKNFEFNVCNYVSSGSGLSYCSAKAEKEANKEYLNRIKELTPKLKNNAGDLLIHAFSVAGNFIEEKAWKEELHGGSGYAAWTRESIMQQKSEYLDLIEK
jgi:tetratricopeptide (TPR) repeat protein